MKLNLKVRARNPSFWMNIALSLAMPIFGYFGLTAADLTSWSSVFETIFAAIMNPYVVMLMATSVWNELHDPTTQGYSDSLQALLYVEPGKLKPDSK